MGGRRLDVYRAALERRKEIADLVRRRYDEKKAAAGETAGEEEREREVAWELNPKAEPDEPREFLLTPEERKELRKVLGGLRYQPSIQKFLLAQTLAAEKRWFEALEALQAVELQGARPALLVQTGDLLRRLNRPREAEEAYQRALALNPDNVHAYLGMCRVALGRRDYEAAARAAQDVTGRLYFHPVAHFLGAVARIGLGKFVEARDGFLTALAQNPNFPQAHLWLGRLYRFRLREPERAKEHFGWYREIRESRKQRTPEPAAARTEHAAAGAPVAARLEKALPPLGDDVFVVSGLPRSGTSMLMQMLEAGGMPILTDKVREADEDNPRGYFELEAVKSLFRDGGWLTEARGKAVKVVAPLVCSLPGGCCYRVLLIERDYDEILASQAKMIARRGEKVEETLERRERLRQEYGRQMARTKAALASRPDVRWVVLRHEEILRDPGGAAAEINRLAGGELDAEKMARPVDLSLYRNQRARD
jgi:tetratricopeptide (TPR) repeat protein